MINKPEITKDWLSAKINEQPVKVIGRALSAIYKNQTAVEQSATFTRERNGIGFSKPDARIGSIGARMYMAHGTLQDWVVEIWKRPGKDGIPRICKYAHQLNEIVKLKQSKLLPRQTNVIFL